MSNRTTPSVPATLGERVAECRERLGWTQKTLADKARLGVPFLSDLENDKRTVGSEALLRLANALGASLDYLLKGELAPSESEPLVIPAPLAQAAQERGWSLSEAADLLKADRMVVARRSRSGEAGERVRPRTKDEWIHFHKRLYDDVAR